MVSEEIITLEACRSGGRCISVPRRRLRPGLVAGRQIVRGVGLERGGEHGRDLLVGRIPIQFDSFHQRILEVRGVVGKHLRTLEVGYHQQSFKGIEGSVVRQHAQMVAYIGDE